MTSPRLPAIIERFGDALLRSVQEREPENVAGMTRGALVDLFADHAPSHNKSATQWLVTTYLKGGFHLEDLPSARETLELFGRNRRRLPVGDRYIGEYDTVSAIWKLVKPFVEEKPEDVIPSGHELRRMDRSEDLDPLRKALADFGLRQENTPGPVA